MDPELWYREWSTLCMKAKAYNVPEVTGLLAVQDFLDALAPRMATEWARSVHRTMLEREALTKTNLKLYDVGKMYSLLLQEHKIRAIGNNPLQH